MIVGVEGPARDELAAGREVAEVEHDEPLWGREQRVVAPLGERCEPLADAAQVERARGEPPDQPDHRPVGVEVVPPETHLGEHDEEGARDRIELLVRQLVERQPLAEDAAGREPARDGLEHLARVEAARPRVPGDEEVRDDDVVPVGARGEPAAPVTDHELYVGAPEERRVPGAEVGARRRCDLGDDLDHRRPLHAERRARARGDAGRHADERDSLRRRMQQEREETLPTLVGRGGAAAEHVVVVEAQLEVVAGVDHRHDARRALGERAEGLAGCEVCEGGPHRVEGHQSQQRGVAERAEPRTRRRDQVGEDDVRDRGEEKPRPETDRRQHDEARRERAADRAQRVGGRELAERPGCPVAIAERRPQGGQHGAGGEGTRPCGHRRETDDTEHVLAEPRLHADVGEALRRADEEPDAADRRCGGAQECAARDHGGRRTSEEERRQRGAGREREQEDETHGGEGIDRVVQHLREEPGP